MISYISNGMNNKVKIGILGCADIAKRYAIKAFQSIDNCEVVSIASRNPVKAKEWALDFNIQAEESYDSLLNNKDIDAVYIPLPVGLHKEWALKAVAVGKHIICEKSLAEDFESVKSIVSACQSKGVVLYENFMTDFHPQHQKVLSIIENGDIGEPFIFRSFFGFPPLKKDNIRYDSKLGGGCLNDVGAHIVFMARKIFKKEPVSVMCNLINDKKLGVDTGGTAVLEFSDGQAALMGFSFCSSYQNNYSVWGSKAVLNVKQAYSIRPDTKPIVELTQIQNYQEVVTQINAPSANQFEILFHDFCDTILNQENRAEKINNIYLRLLAQAKVLEAMRLSALENRMVEVKEIK